MHRNRRNLTKLLFLPGVALLVLITEARWATAAAPTGLTPFHGAHAFLSLPPSTNAPLPQRLSQTGAFRDVARLMPASGLVPYDINVSFWSDGAEKSRWCAVPDSGKIGFSPTGEWTFPAGTVFVKHFEIATNDADPTSRRRLETRLLVRTPDGGVYGATYKWRADNRDADLLSSNLTEAIPIRTSTGIRTQLWYYPSRQDCLQCHTRNAGGVLGVKTRQLNRTLTSPSGTTENQLRAWSQAGLFSLSLNDAEIQQLPALAQPDDPDRSLEDRARSYLDANCAQCHRPKGTVANFDARYDTPLARQGLIDGEVLINEGIDHARIIAPHDVWRSILLLRISTNGDLRMPPLARNTVDERGNQLIRDWIESLPGPPVLNPPSITPAGGHFDHPVLVTLNAQPQAAVHYTLDGSMPTEKDPLYEKPFTLSAPAVVRAKSFRPGYTRSITAQQVYVVSQ